MQAGIGQRTDAKPLEPRMTLSSGLTQRLRLFAAARTLPLAHHAIPIQKVPLLLFIFNPLRNREVCAQFFDASYTLQYWRASKKIPGFKIPDPNDPPEFKNLGTPPQPRHLWLALAALVAVRTWAPHRLLN